MKTGFFRYKGKKDRNWEVWEIKKKQRIWLLTGMVLVGAFLWAGSVFAAEKVSVDRYLRSKRYDTYYVYNDSSQSIPLYMGRSTVSQIYGYLGYGDAVKLQKSLLKRGKKYRFLPVYMPREKGTLYVVADQVKVKGIRLKQMSTNPLRHKVVRYGIKFLGTPFSLGSSSLTGGIDCANFVKACYQYAGIYLGYPHTDNLWFQGMTVPIRNLRAGDLLFYLENDTYGPIGHVAMYLGDGFIIHASGHYGETYPFGGICVKRVNYGNRRPVLCKRIIQG